MSAIVGWLKGKVNHYQNGPEESGDLVIGSSGEVGTRDNNQQ
ncbi:MAG TPA: hypothetical protein VJR04_14890 [Terriglobales bacterium]|nr:hypothetical protein [Terriglobales bacterium]